MTIGQLSELVALSLMSFLVKRFSRKTLLAVGIIAYAVHCAVRLCGANFHGTGVRPLVVIIIGLAMHGLVFGCFIFVAFLIVDEETTTDVRQRPKLVQSDCVWIRNYRRQPNCHDGGRVGHSKRRGATRLHEAVRRSNVGGGADLGGVLVFAALPCWN